MTTLMLYKSYQYIGVGTATTLHFLYPVFVALICRLFYKEHFSLQKVLALILAALGILFFINKNQITSLLGLVLAIASGLTYSFYMIGVEKLGLKDSNPYQVSFYIAITVSIALLLYNLPTQRIVFTLPPKAFLYTLIISFCTSFLAVVLLQLGIKYLGATTAAILCLFEPITSMVSGAMFLGEQITLQNTIGCTLVIAAVAILVIKFPLKKSKAATHN
jgi:drug/metabolite transporter (DMT)-like permease